MKLSLSRSFVPVLVAAALSSLPATSAFAAGKGKAAAAKKDPLADLIDLNKKAVADLQAGRFEAARDTLLEAMVAAKDADLAEHDMMARTHVHLGATYFLGFKDRNRAIAQFTKALKINPKITLTSQLKTPALEETFEAAKSGGTAPAAKADADVESAKPAAGGKKVHATPVAPVSAEEPEPPATVADDLFCPLPDEIPPGEDLVIRCVTKKQPKKSTAKFFYRAPGSESFTSVSMTRSSRGWLMATVPGSAIAGSAFQFYIEANVPGHGTPVSNGSSDNPSLLPVVEGAEPMGMDGLARLVQKRAGSADKAGGPVQEEDILARFKEQKKQEEEDRLYHRRPAGSWFISVGGGMGMIKHGALALDSGSHDGSGKDLRITAGDSPASLFHVAPEIGYQATEKLAISAQVRYQNTPYDASGVTLDTSKGEKYPPTKAFAFLARAQYAFLTKGNFQLFGSGVAGGGNFLAYFAPNCKENCETKANAITHSDTVTSGPALAGAGVGFLYHFSRNIGFYAEGREIVSLPKAMLLSEFNAGLTFGYKFEKSEPAPVMTEGGWEKPPEAEGGSDDAPSE